MNDFNEEYDRKTLDKMYEKLKLTLSEERIELLRRYFDAVNNFYQIIQLKRIFQIINSQNTQQYSEEDFLTFAEIACNERHFYSILGKDEFYDNEPVGEPFEKYLIHESLVEFDLLYEMAEAKCNKPYYVPPKDELLMYEDEFYEFKSPQYTAMAEYVLNNIECRSEYVEDVMSEILFIIKGEKSSPIEAINFLTKCGLKADLSEKQFKEFSKLYIDLHNNTRNPYNNGFTPKEMLQRTGDIIGSRYLNESKLIKVLSNDDFGNFDIYTEPIRTKKIGRNELCPCGSGKKYKKCCGR